MQGTTPTLGTENQSPYQVDSRREILSLLKGLKEANQLVSMSINGGAEVFITSILDVDDHNDEVIVDCTPSQLSNQRVLESSKISFEGLLDRISIQFSTNRLNAYVHQNRPAFKFSLPQSMIRLQRREYYRINTPVTNPIRALIPVIIENKQETLRLSLVDISCGGIAILDEKKILENTVGTMYPHCKIDLPNIGLIEVTLQIRNSQDLILMNGKSNRRLGCQFINLSNAVLASVQRYIMKLERERNSKITGIR